MLRCPGVPELSAEAGGMDGGVCGIGASFSAILQDCTRQGNVVDVAVAGLLLWTMWKEKSKTE